MIEFRNLQCAFCHSSDMVETNKVNISALKLTEDKAVIRHFFHCNKCSRKNCVDEIYNDKTVIISLQTAEELMAKTSEPIKVEGPDLRQMLPHTVDTILT